MLVLLMRVIMKYTIEMATGGMINTPCLMTIGSGIREILRILFQKFEGL
jgi:hypothetical protein